MPFKNLLKSRYRWLVIAVVIIAVIGASRYAFFLSFPPGDGQIVKIVDFAKGSSLKKLADELEKSGVLGSSRLFIFTARLRGVTDKLQAGTYQFTDAMPPADILGMLERGEVYEKRFAVPEGYSIYQLAEMLEGKELFAKAVFLKECSNPALLKELGIKGKTVEGYLYPSTYNLANIDDPEVFVKMMTTQFFKIWNERFASLEKSSGLNRQQIVTLASIVEKEAVVPSEKPLIASVFLNRLKKRMPLQSDPTALYGVRSFAGAVKRKDILRSTPYNTYKINGLPPGPIGNPGEGAIEAVLKPASTGYYYFVAKKDGTHHFSATLDEHNRAVNLYLKGKGLPAYRNDHKNITGRR